MNGLRQGQGVWSSADGSVRYDGQWSAGLKHGRGAFVSAGKASYVGEFKLGLMDGTGTLLHDDGQKYEGSFRAGLKHGVGKLFLNDGNIYEGAFERDLMHGRGVLTLADGTQQRGRFQEGFLEGQGEQLSETDVTYTGEWKGGKFHGAGVLQTREGDSFDGKFSLGLPMGQGSWRLADGRILCMLSYKCFLVANISYCLLTPEIGTSIVGQWNGGSNQVILHERTARNLVMSPFKSKQASGCIIYPDGSRYDGSMKAVGRMTDVVPHGRGVRTCAALDFLTTAS